jgi:hypothetical protein
VAHTDNRRIIRLDVFGRHVLVIRDGSGWKAFYAGEEGKRRPATDIVVPNDICETALEQYLADLCHEWSTERNPGVKRLE